jgi:fructoselysine 6-phosphate deglycase
MSDLNGYIEQAKNSDYFNGYRLGDDLARLLASGWDGPTELADRLRGSIDHIFLVGSGGSYANMLVVKYIFDSLVDVAVDAVPSYELIWRHSTRLTQRSVVFLASWSGETEDTLAAMRCATERGAHTVALVRSADSTIGREADTTFPYDSAALFEAPIALLTIFGARLAAGTERAGEGEALASSLRTLPALIRRVVAEEETRVEARARSFLYSNHMYVLASGPLSPLAYKMAMSVIMENIRIGATYSDACEFRHGPVEALERLRPDVMFLLGTDESREMSLRTLDICRENGANLLVYDAADLGDVHPLLTPIVMNPILQWFIVYSAILRGILDLDDRVFMGHQVLSVGGARWP